MRKPKMNWVRVNQENRDRRARNALPVVVTLEDEMFMAMRLAEHDREREEASEQERERAEATKDIPPERFVVELWLGATTRCAPEPQIASLCQTQVVKTLARSKRAVLRQTLAQALAHNPQAGLDEWLVVHRRCEQG
jgi:hypothetical protein